MRERTVYITEYDRQRLHELIAEHRRQDPGPNVYLDDLEGELARAQLVAPADVPPDVVTMNSKVRLVDLEDNDEMIYTLVFPTEADLGEGKISVLAPIGTAMLGYREGDVFEWKVPDGVRKLKVAEIIYQPEASGNYDL